MIKNDDERKKLIDKFQKIRTKNGTLFLHMGGGIFTSKTRKKVLGILKRPKPGQPTNDFWQDRRDNVERALIDLQLFIEAARKDDVNLVITRESLEPIVISLLWRQLFEVGPEKEKAEIAQLLIENGFNYLQGMFHSTDYHLPLSSKRTIEEAVDLSKYMVSQVEELRKSARQRKEMLARA